MWMSPRAHAQHLAGLISFLGLAAQIAERAEGGTNDKNQKTIHERTRNDDKKTKTCAKKSRIFSVVGVELARTCVN